MNFGISPIYFIKSRRSELEGASGRLWETQREGEREGMSHGAHSALNYLVSGRRTDWLACLRCYTALLSGEAFSRRPLARYLGWYIPGATSLRYVTNYWTPPPRPNSPNTRGESALLSTSTTSFSSVNYHTLLSRLRHMISKRHFSHGNVFF